MKKNYIFLSLLALFAICVSAQDKSPKRLVLIEEFTNTGCGPCASWSPLLDSCINYRLGDCIAIKYHSGFPNKADEFYLNEQETQQDRVNFYGINAVPTTFVDGQDLGERSYAFLNQAVSYCQQQPEKFAIELSKQLDGKKLTAKVALMAILSQYNDNLPTKEELAKLRLHIAVIEEHITSTTPWPNGEKELNYTMRKMNTTELYSSIESMGWETELDSFDNISELGVLAFIQNVETHEILATAYSGPDAEGENRLALQNLIDTPDLICTPDYYGKVILRNDGANAITSATLNVKVNGSVKQYPWTGNLGYLERDTMAFDGFTEFELVTSNLNSQSSKLNSVEVWFTDINGSEAVSNTRTSQFSNSVQASYGVQLKLYTDKKPEETTWKLYDSNGDVIQEGGPYTGQPRKFITVDFDLKRDDCYLLEFLDAGGDGIKGSAGNGYYQLLQKNAEGKTTRIAQGDYSGSVHDVNFRLTDTPAPPHRLVLFEEFTNTSCDPCADFSPALDEVLYRRMGDVVAITYHYNFPSPQDPFYLVSADDVMARASYYDVTGVPSLRVNGEHAGAWGYEKYLDAYIDYAGATEEKVKIETMASYTQQRTRAAADGEQKWLKMDVGLNAVKDAKNARLFIALVEERVEWNTPAANGERAWNYVLRKMWPNGEGQEIRLNAGDQTAYEYYIDVTGFDDENEMGIVTFVQDMDTKEVLGVNYTPRPACPAKILKVLNTPTRICTPLFTSDLMVRNTGREPLTSATLNVSINGTVQQTPWTGRLEYLQIDTLHTPAFTDFTLAGDKANDVEIWLSDLNGTKEETPHKTFTLANAYKAQNAVRLTIMTDNAPEEITWKLHDSAGEVVAEGGPYTESRKKQVIDLPISYDDCYTLRFSDNGDNGINGENGRGYYMLHEVSANGKTRLLVQSTYAEAQHEVFFSVENVATVGIDTTVADEGSDETLFDLGGRRAGKNTKGIVVGQDKKMIKTTD